MVNLKRVAMVVFVALAACFGLSMSQPEAGVSQTADPDRPNIVFVLTDDLDVESASRMPKIQSLLAERGTSFERAYVTTPSCCPSRASILTGKYAHNHTVYDNTAPDGGATKFHASAEEASTIATWLDKQGYETFLAGKYFNQYDGSWVPPNWDSWRGQIGRYRYNVDGEILSFDPAERYHTDLLGDWATAAIRDSSATGAPFFLYLSPHVPHEPLEPQEQHRGAFSDEHAPRPPSFNEEDVSDKPTYMRKRSLLGEEDIAAVDTHYRERLQATLSVDDLVERLVTTIQEVGALDNTYVVFASDNGYHMGQHRLPPGKGRPYEEDINIPLIVRGPGVPQDQTISHPVLNTDLAPTFAELAGTSAPPSADGRSFAALLDGSTSVDSWRKSFLVEKFHGAFLALRTEYGYSYVEHENGDRELYDLNTDPYQLESLHNSPEYQPLMDELHARIETLKSCSGRASCEAAEKAGSEAGPPTVSLTAPGDGTVVRGARVALAAEASDDGGVDSVQFLVDGSVVGTDTTAPYSVDWDSWSVSDGTHNVVAKAFDTTENQRTSTAREVIVDNLWPDSTITSGPTQGGFVESATATFGFSSEAGATFECKLDGGTFASCVSPKTYTPLANGSHTFSVRATDAAGNEDATPAQRTWTVDAPAPTVKRVVPEESAKGIAPGTNVSAFFYKEMRPASINTNTIKLFKTGTTTPLASRVTYDTEKKKATLDPDANLQHGAKYKVVVTTGARDLAGNKLDQDPTVSGNQSKVWFFEIRT